MVDMSNLSNQSPERMRNNPREGLPSRRSVPPSEAQKGWFEEYVYSKDWPVLGTLAKWLTLKPVEGIVTGVTGSNLLGKAARVGAIGGAVYLSAPYVMNAFAMGEGAASGTGLDWLSRLNQARGRLGTAMPRDRTPPPMIPGETVPYEFR